MEFHQKQLHQHCRICARNLEEERVVRKCLNYDDNIEKYLGISLSEDDDTIHPQFLGDRCHATLRNKDKERDNSTTLTLFEWSAHVYSHCTVSTLYTYIIHAHTCIYMYTTKP